jgi:photosystem I P700 chlorophyll a apoprotein A1
MGTVNRWWCFTGGNFAQSANTNGWLRDFLWAQSSQVIQSYGSALSAYGLIFLGAHFVFSSNVLIQWSWLLARIN